MPVDIDANILARFVSDMLEAAGLDGVASARVADALVEADSMGLASHGVMLAEMYLRRVQAGSVSLETAGTVVSDQQAVTVLDGRNAFGVLVADQAMAMAIDKAKSFGLGAVAVRHAFHFGAARRFAVAAADAGCVGIAMCNTRPLMPAPGGADRVVGNNPIAVAFPVDGDVPLVLDMATSEAAMGKIRMAARAGREIPDTWAVRSDGSATTDPNEAIDGMLLPSAGPKGFGLAVMIDLMSGLLSGGAAGPAVQPLYGDMSVPYDCSHLFIAMDAGHFGDAGTIAEQAAAYAEAIRGSRRAPGVDRLYTPGEPEWERKRASGGRISVGEPVWDGLSAMAASLGVVPPSHHQS